VYAVNVNELTCNNVLSKDTYYLIIGVPIVFAFQKCSECLQEMLLTLFYFHQNIKHVEGSVKDCYEKNTT